MVESSLYEYFLSFLANGDDLCTMQFEQKKMRQHLAECFQNQKFQPFPHSVSPKRIMGKYFPGKVIEVYCDCELPESYDDMIACDNCDNWYHQSCVGIQSEPTDDEWICNECSS